MNKRKQQQQQQNNTSKRKTSSTGTRKLLVHWTLSERKIKLHITHTKFDTLRIAFRYSADRMVNFFSLC